MKKNYPMRCAKLPGMLTVCYFMLSILTIFSLSSGVRAEGGEGGKMLSADTEKQKSDIEKSIDRVQELLATLKFQDARGAIELADRKLERAKKNLSGEDALDLSKKIEKARKGMAAKEDSLVNVTFDILKVKGSDTALLFTQDELRGHGVTETKISAAEKRVLDEGPAIKQAKDKEELAKTLSLLESGQTPPPSTDIFILQSAQRILKIRADSIKAIAEVKAKKEFEERQHQEVMQKEKEAKEKKLEEEQLVKQKKEEEKKRREAEEAEKKRLAAQEERQKQLQAQQEKAHKDSIDAARKIAERAEAQLRDSLKRIEDAQVEKERAVQEQQQRQRKALAAQQEKAHKDSLDAQKRAQEQVEKARRDREEKEQAAREEENSRKKALAAQQEKVHKDSLDAQKRAQEQVEKKRRDQEEKEQAVREEENSRKKALAARQEKAHKDSLDALRKTQDEMKLRRTQEEKVQSVREEDNRSKKIQSVQLRQARTDSIVAARKAAEQMEKQQKLQSAAMEKARKDSLDAQRKLVEKQAKEEKRKTKAGQKDKDRAAVKDEGQPALSADDREKSRNDSLEAQRWGSIQLTKQDKRREEQLERQRFARLIEEERQRKIAFAAQDQARTDSIENARKARDQIERQRRLQEDQERAVFLNEQRRNKEKAVVVESSPQIKTQKTISSSPSPRDDAEDRQGISQRDENRRQQLDALQEKARQEYKKKLEADNVKMEKQRQRRGMAQMGQDSVNGQGKNVRIHVEIDKEAQKYDSEPGTSSSPAASSQAGKAIQTGAVLSGSGDLASNSRSSARIPQENSKKTTEKRVAAEKYIAAIYKLLEKNKFKEALQQYKRNREYLAQYSDPEVVGVLEQSLSPLEAAPAPAPQSSVASSVARAVPVPSDPQPSAKPSKADNITGHEQESLTRINDFLQDDNVAAAYAEFKKAEAELRNYLTKDEFGNFKTMIETAYKTRQR